MNNRRMITRDSKARSVLEISKAMTDWKISKSSVAITDEKGKQVIGILTERDDDVVVNSIAKAVPPDSISVLAS